MNFSDTPTRVLECLSEYIHIDPEYARALTRDINRAHVFLLPPRGDLYYTDPHGRDLSDLEREMWGVMPYEYVFVEFPFREGEPSTYAYLAVSGPERPTLIQPFMYNPSWHSWVPFPLALELVGDPMRSTIVHTGDTSAWDAPKREYAEDILHQIQRSALQFSVVMGCSNTFARTIRKAPRSLNIRRAQKGKPPLFEYKVLDVKPGSVAETKGGAKGTHASPRLHTRRGHIRRLPSGKAVWVKPCLVGSKDRGMIHKDYRVHEHA